jgi:hypothetical protein
MAAASSQTSGYAFTPPNRAKIASALEGLKPFSRVMSPTEFTRDVASAYDIADDQRNAPSMALAKANLALADAGLRAANISIEGANSLGQGIIQAGSGIAQGLIQGYTGKEEQRMALEAEERKHGRALEIEAIKSARSSEALQKRVEYLREAAANRLAEVGANKKPPRKLIGGTATVPSPRGGGVEDEEDLEGETPLEPDLGAPLVDLPLPDLLPAPVEVPETEQTQYNETLPPEPVQRPLFELTPPPVMPSGRDVIPPDFSMRGIIPEEAARFASAEAGGVPQPLPSSAIGLPLTDLAGQINIAYIPSETARQMQELQQQGRGLVLSTEAPLAQMAPPTPVAPAEFPAGMQPGAYATYEEARSVSEIPLPENYERPEVVPRVDNQTGETYFEVMAPKLKSTPSELDRIQLEKAKIELEKSKGGAVGPNTDDEQKLRKEFIAQSKDYMVVQNAWANIKSAQKMAESGGEGAGDLAMIFSFMKLLDPGSVVREQEFANAQNAAGVPDRIRAEYNRLLTGGRLAPDQRKNFVKQGKSLFMERQRGQNQLSNVYRKLAEQSGLRAEMVAIDLETPDPLGQIDSKIRAKLAEMTSLQKGTEEYDAKFDELKEFIAQKKALQAEEEQAIAVD